MQGRRIITQQQADLNGDGSLERVLLTGLQAEDSAAWRSIRLYIREGCLESRLPLPEDAGYAPRLWIGPLTGEGRQDILVSIASGGRGGLGYYTIFTYREGGYERIFDTESYNGSYAYEIDYLDQYRVRAASLANAVTYLVDIAWKGLEYLGEIYTPQGVLKAPLSGEVDPLSVLAPVDLSGSGVYSLMAFQRISGRYHADGLGDFINVLDWNGQTFALTWQTLGIQGA